MANILILANNDVGLYKFRKELIEELVKTNKVYISLPNGEFIPRLIEIGCIFIDTQINRRGTNPITDLKLLINYIRTIKSINPDVVLTYTIKPNIYGGIACRFLGVPYISNITGLGTAVENDGILQKITLFLYKKSLKKANVVFFQNKENEKFFLSKKIFVGKHKLVPGSGVNLDYYYLMDYPSEELIQFLFIGRIMKEKGIDHYLDAAIYIKNKYPNTVFHILGNCDAAYIDKLREMQKEGIIIYHGIQDDVREFQKIAHCTIHPTYYPEGMSNVLLESAACGRPIITTNRSGCKEIVDDSITGFLVEQRNSKDLIEKIEKFLMLDYKEKIQLGYNGRLKVSNEFNRVKVISAYMEEIDEVIKGGV